MIEEKNAPQRRGTEPFSRFGSCVAAVGDLDGDGYEGTLHFHLFIWIYIYLSCSSSTVCLFCEYFCIVFQGMLVDQSWENVENWCMWNVSRNEYEFLPMSQ